MRKIAVLVLGIFLVTTNPGAAWAFFDTQGHWAGVNIDHLTARGIIHGRSGEIFDPEAAVTRAEFAALLVNCLGLEDQARSLQKGASSFVDVGWGFWGKGSLELCYELGIMVPDPYGFNYPGRNLTRAEAAVMAAQLLALEEKSEYEFADQGIIPDWAQERIGAVRDAGIMQGFPDDTFRPWSYLTRAEASVIIGNLLEYRGDRYSGSGQLLSLNMDSRRASLLINGKSYAFDLADSFTFSSGASQRVLGLPVPCLFNVNKEGKLVYCLQTQEDITVPSDLFVISRAAASPNQITRETHLWSPETDPDLYAESSEQEQRKTSEPRVSSSLNDAEVRGSELRALADVDGTGVKIAVIDTGIDPGHHDLSRTPDGRVKIADWIDLTDQGKISLSPIPVEQGHIDTPEGQISLGDYGSVSGVVHYGYLDPASLPVKLEDNQGRKVLAAALDANRSQFYDTVLIDTNSDGRFDDEKALLVYSSAQQFGTFLTDDRTPFNFVISYISPTGSYVKLGFDAVGHGTKVAGVMAAYGLMQGVAPGAQIAAIKVYDGLTGNDTSRLKQAIRLCADMGVQVVNISMGFSGLADKDRLELESLINQVSAASGITFCIAAGNLGPGLDTISNPAGSQAGIAVGGFLSPEMWRVNYGWSVSEPTIWSFSSVGPYGGGLSPLVVAPASAITTNVKWRTDYTLEEGTSIASPYVAGGTALLIQAARQEGLSVSPKMLQLAIARGAKSLSGYTVVEAGWGALDLMQSWQELQSLPSMPLEVDQGVEGRGLYERSYFPGGSYLQMMNPTGYARFLELTASSPWIKLEQESIQVPAGETRTLAVGYDIPTEPGLYTGMVTGIDKTSREKVLESLQTIIVPYWLSANSGANVAGEIPAGMYQRYYFKVPEGSGQMKFNISIPRDDFGKYEGRVRAYLMDPSGQQVYSTGYAGSGYPDTSAYEFLDIVRDNPAGGVWELVVYSSVSMAQYQRETSRFNITARLVDWTVEPPRDPDDKYIVTTAPPVSPGEGDSWVTLNFWDKVTKIPAKGRVLINNLVYEIKNGKVQLQVSARDQFPWFQIAW